MENWCVGALLKISELDLKVAKLLYDDGFYAQALFYMHQAVEKIGKAYYAYAIAPDEVKKKEIKGIIEKNMNLEDYICSYSMMRVGHKVFSKIIEIQRRNIQEYIKSMQLLLKVEQASELPQELRELASSFDKNFLKESIDELTKIHEYYAQIQSMADRISKEFKNERIPLTEKFRLLGGIIKQLIQLHKELTITMEKGISELRKILTPEKCTTEFVEEAKRTFFADFLRSVSRIVVGDENKVKEIEEMIYRAILPCLCIMYPEILRTITLQIPVNVIAVLGIVLERIKWYSWTRYPESKSLGPHVISLEHLQAIRFNDIIEYLKDVINVYRLSLELLNALGKNIDKCLKELQVNMTI